VIVVHVSVATMPPAVKVNGESKGGFVRLKMHGAFVYVPFSQTVDYTKPNPKKSGGCAWRRYEGYMSAATIGEALESGCWVGDLSYDLSCGYLSLPGFRGATAHTANGKASKQVIVPPPPATAAMNIRQVLARGMLDEPRKQEPFAYVMSLGSRCLVARVLRDLDLRRFAGPFDWVYSSPQMVRDCLSNDFCKFLDADMLVAQGHSWSHREYSLLLGRGVVFPHHEPRVKDKEFFERSVQRFRLVMPSALRKLFVVVHPVPSMRELDAIRHHGSAEIGRLFADLQAHGASNFDLFAVHLVYGNCSEAACGSHQGPVMRLLEDTCSGKDRMILWELHCVGHCTGLNLKAEADEQMLRKLLIGNSKSMRPFDLQPDPLGKSANVGGGGRGESKRRLLGDPGDEQPSKKRIRVRRRPSSAAGAS